MPTSYWGFTSRPFQKDLGVSELFMSPQLTELAARLQVMVDQRLFGVVTGDIGAGKSCDRQVVVLVSESLTRAN